MNRFVALIPCLFVTSILFFAADVTAETLLIERTQRDAAVERPKRGALMAQVEKQFGEPLSKSAAVGKPPITRWTYAAFSVYFEHDHVISSVLNKSSPRELGPKPAKSE
jgi:hypothetical protein